MTTPIDSNEISDLTQTIADRLTYELDLSLADKVTVLRTVEPIIKAKLNAMLEKEFERGVQTGHDAEYETQTRERDAMLVRARISEVETLLANAREHTITDVEMIMHHTDNKVDFIEAVETKYLTNRLAQLTKGDSNAKL